ncbi:hypothetical protein ACLBXM_01465 [Xanthobacteraceae bacterium A53D]
MTEPRPARIPQGDDLHLLMRCYGLERNRAGRVVSVKTPVDPADRAAAEARGWPIGRTTTLPMKVALDQAVAAVGKLEIGQVMQAFVAGVGGSAPRGRQILISYAWALHLPAAMAAAAPALPDCGLREPVKLDVTKELMRLALGYVWNEMPERYLPDLEAAAAEGLPEPTADDRARFAALVAFIAAQPADTTPGALETAIGREKLLPGTDKYARYGILQGLAECGIMPNPAVPPSLDQHVPRAAYHAAHRELKGAPRSDIVLPLAGWRGAHGIDQARLDQLLPG